MPPTKVEMIKPTVTVIMPALVKRVESDTLKYPRITKVIIRIATPMDKNCTIVASWSPIRGVKSVLIRRKKKRDVKVNMKTRDISTKRSKNIGRFVGPAKKRSKNKIVPAAKRIMKSMNTASFFKDENRLAKEFLPVCHNCRGYFYSFS